MNSSTRNSATLTPTASAPDTRGVTHRGVATANRTDRHLLNRFSYGVTPALVAQTKSLGGSRAWFNQQVRDPARIEDDFVAGLRAWFPRTRYSPEQLWKRHGDGVYAGHEVMWDLQRWTLLRRTYSRRQVLEVMTDFWSNFLHVSAPHDKAWPHRWEYDAVIRRHALGRFDNLLVAAITHPAMGCYLDNGRSTKDNPNENLGRELLELHTVGIGEHYDEKDVLNSALMLTDYRVDIRQTYTASYAPWDHHTGPLRIMDFQHANGSADGRPATQAYLRHLARHPLTAVRLARRLCQQFVRDDPSDALVGHVAAAYRSSGTDIRTTLRALLAHPEFGASVDMKVRTPCEDAIATYRVLGVKALRPTTDQSFANMITFQAHSMGQRPFDWPRPDGFPLVGESWSGVSRVLNSFHTHHLQAGGFFPKGQVQYRKPASFLPRLPAKLGAVVDHVARQMLGRPASANQKAAVSIRLGLAVTEPLTAERLPDFKVIRMLDTLLNTPTHMSR
ncbi:DUF1800 domain-containing protein [soil metagenome]